MRLLRLRFRLSNSACLVLTHAKLCAQIRNAPFVVPDQAGTAIAIVARRTFGIDQGDLVLPEQFIEVQIRSPSGRSLHVLDPALAEPREP